MAQEKKPERKPPRPVTAEYLERAALYYLERFSASSEHLRRVLTRKVMKRVRLRKEGEDAAAFAPLIDALIARYQQNGLLNDTQYAEAQVASLRRRGGSKRGIAVKLMSKGVDKELIHSTLSSDEMDEGEAARIFARRKRLGPWRKEKHDEYRDRDMAALARAGFSYDVVLGVMDETMEDA